MPRLIFTQPEFAVQSCELAEGKTTVGRSFKKDLSIGDAEVIEAGQAANARPLERSLK